MALGTIRCDRVCKCYRSSLVGTKSVREDLTRSLRRVLSRREVAREHDGQQLFALREVSFTVERGATVGFIGPNGSGKSTLLRLLARIAYPTSGQIVVLGSVASVIQLGAGFHPELTGRDNIELYGSMMGMCKSERREQFDSIVSFSELPDFLDTPIKHYSTGMYLRLAFAIAAYAAPDVLLIDEVLAVGDAAFQSKCLQRIEELRNRGTTIVFVSHDMNAVERLCDRVFLLAQGRIVAEGEAQAVIADYYRAVTSKHLEARNEHGTGVALPRSYAPKQTAEVTGLRFLDAAGEESDAFATGAPLTARIEYRVLHTVEAPVFELFFYAADGRLHCHYSTAFTDDPLSALSGSGTAEFVCDELGLMPGTYIVGVALTRRGCAVTYARETRGYRLQVMPGKQVRGIFYSPHRWRILPSFETWTVTGSSSTSAR
jgi:ABC-type polysaccharide/polyol phosphate transport system ATPase subunit